MVDLDAVEASAALLAAEVRPLGLGLWFVAKQFGRNPELIRAVARHNPAYAAIDLPEARILRAGGARPGNLGHLRQVPVRDLPEVLTWRPETVTVFDLANAAAVSRAAERLGVVQDVLIRLESAPGHRAPGAREGGVPLGELDTLTAEFEGLPGIRVAGVTGFPCVLCDPASGQPRATRTFDHAVAAHRILADRGHTDLILSTPSATSVAALPLLAERGATHGEPGHALTGTTPLHAADPGQPERPAYVYVSEVAHTLADGRPAVFGGGFYPRGGARNALLPRSQTRATVEPAPAENIDYYRVLTRPPPAAAEPGDRVIFAFRTQMFVTLSTIAIVSGLATSEPRLRGLYDAHGRAVR